MREAVLDALIDENNKKHGSKLPPTEEAKVRAMLAEKLGTPPVAFAHAGKVYVAEDASDAVLGHEAIHTMASPSFGDFKNKSVPGYDPKSVERRVGFDEAMTEYFNRQLPAGTVAEPGSGYFTERANAVYGHGPNVVSELRDKYLGSEKGEKLLRDCYFGNDCKPLEGALANSFPGGSKGFISAVSDTARDRAVKGDTGHGHAGHSHAPSGK